MGDRVARGVLLRATGLLETIGVRAPLGRSVSSVGRNVAVGGGTAWLTIRRVGTSAACRLSSTPSSSLPPSPPTLPACSETIEVTYQRGLPIFTVSLPSRREACQFSLRPLTDTVSTLCEHIRAEDRGLDHVVVYTNEGVRVASGTSVEHLLQFGGFRLRLNDQHIQVTIPDTEQHVLTSSDRLRSLDDIKATVAQLHAALCVDEYKVARERALVQRLESAEHELKPLQEKKQQIELECEQHAERVMWAGFAFMGVQTGVFARLTWWEYSWDIMEPVTYFATYASVVATMAYFLYTRQTFEYNSARDRVYTKTFYKKAAAHEFDIDRYNTLVTEVEELRRQLERIRDPLFQHLPVSYLSNLDKAGLHKIVNKVVDQTTAKH